VGSCLSGVVDSTQRCSESLSEPLLSWWAISPVIAFSLELLAFLHPCNHCKTLTLIYMNKIRRSLFATSTGLADMVWYATKIHLKFKNILCAIPTCHWQHWKHGKLFGFTSSKDYDIMRQVIVFSWRPAGVLAKRNDGSLEPERDTHKVLRTKQRVEVEEWCWYYSTFRSIGKWHNPEVDNNPSPSSIFKVNHSHIMIHEDTRSWL